MGECPAAAPRPAAPLAYPGCAFDPRGDGCRCTERERVRRRGAAPAAELGVADADAGLMLVLASSWDELKVLAMVGAPVPVRTSLTSEGRNTFPGCPESVPPPSGQPEKKELLSW